jgi:hypothetical protein
MLLVLSWVLSMLLLSLVQPHAHRCDHYYGGSSDEYCYLELEG